MKIIPLFDLAQHNRPFLKKFPQFVKEAIQHSELTVGKAIPRFEKKFAAFHQTKYAVGTRSGTASLIIALKAAGIQPGDEVITTPVTFTATADAIVLTGAKPVFVDVHPNTGNIDHTKITRALSRKTRAILAVHLYGVPAEMNEIRKIAQKHSLAVIEDAAHADGSLYRGKPVGGLSDAGCFSLYPSKTLGALGNAGVITTNRKTVYEKVLLYAHHGIKKSKDRHTHYVNGYNELIDAIQAAFLAEKMKSLSRWIRRRRQIARQYNAVFQKYGHPGMIWPAYTEPSFYVYAVQMPQREKFQAFLQKRGIETGIYYPLPLHLQPAFSFLHHTRGDFPAAEKFVKQTVSLPLYPELTQTAVHQVTEAVRQFFKQEKS